MNTIILEPASADRQPEAGFSLVEVLIAVVVLIFGIISVANLMVVAAANNMAANQGSAAVAAAMQEMELLRAQPFANLAGLPPISARVVGVAPGADEHAVGAIHVITKLNPVLIGSDATRPTFATAYFITVTATPMSAVNARAPIVAANPPVTRSQAVFTSFRTEEGP